MSKAPSPMPGVPMLARYASAVVATALFLGFGLALQSWLGFTAGYLLFFPAIILAARYGGPAPGVVALLLSAACLDLFFLQPLFSVRIADPADTAALAIFTAIGGVVIWSTQSLRRSEQQFREAAADAERCMRQTDAIFEAIPDALYVGTMDRITRVNAGALEMLGATSLDGLNTGIPEIGDRLEVRSAATGKRLDVSVRPFARALQGEVVVEELIARRGATGEDVRIRCSAAPIREGGQVVGAVTMHADLTEEHRSHERHAAADAANAMRRLTDLVANVPGVVWEAWGEPGETGRRVTFVSEHVREMLGYEPANWTSTPNFWLTILHPDDRQRAEQEARAIFASGQPGRSEFRWVRRDGRPIWVEAHSSVVVDAQGQALGMRGVTLDIESRKRLEQEREELLAREQQARHDAVTANRLKDEFLATLSHELRTPLNAILGYARLLRLGAVTPGRQPHAIEVIERNAKALTRLVSDVLDVSRIIAGKTRLELRPVDIRVVVEEAISSVRPAADAKGVRLNTVLEPPPVRIAGDPDRLQQVIWNLLSNAVRFTPRDGTVELRVEALESDLEIVVRDTGIGIPLDFLPHVFERFRQADSRLSREYGGLGLGLAITRELVGLHGGTIDAFSDGPGCGATFRVRLPLKASERHEAEAARPARRGQPSSAGEISLAGVSVLVVDDDGDALALMRDALENTGATTITAAGGAAALQIVSRTHVDVIVSDLGMPGMDGFEFMAEIRNSANDQVRATPALALTAYASADDEQRSLEGGFQRHLSKPIEPTELVTIVGALSGRLQEHHPADARQS